MAGGLADIGGIQGEKKTMQDLNARLAYYLERVRSLEADNQRLKIKIREHLEKKGPQVRDWGHYFKTIEDLRAQIFEIGEAEMTLTEMRGTVQSLEINLDSMRKLKASLESSLREVKTHYAMQMEQLTGVLLQMESELSQTRAEGQCQAQNFEALLNVKVKLEAENATYCHLLEDGEDFSLTDALDSSNSLQTIQKTTTRKIMDGKVVSETNHTKILKC
uniref:IF rod domain-containing protein n=2 Tax=Canis lupus familiaris TaxID=9615 RepID=A0A8C0T7M2_CANLF